MKKLCVIFLLAVMGYAGYGLAQEEGEGRPGLLVTPTRVVMEGKYRSASVSLVNNGNATGTYKISLINKRMDENGSIVEASKAEPGDMFADGMLRISPRRITLKPGEHQNVRILARKPKDLPDGEYRSHLSFTILPDDALSEREKRNKGADDKSLIISIQANFGMTIPVIVREGTLSSSAQIENFSVKSDADGKPHASFTVKRDGDKSLYGDIQIIFTKNGGKQYVVKSLGGLAVYTPNQKRNFDLKLDVPSGTALKGGTLEVIYQEKETEGGKILAQRKLEL